MILSLTLRRARRSLNELPDPDRVANGIDAFVHRCLGHSELSQLRRRSSLICSRDSIFGIGIGDNIMKSAQREPGYKPNIYVQLATLQFRLVVNSITFDVVLTNL